MTDVADNIAASFHDWVSEAFAAKCPPGIAGFSFNLYEHEDNFAIELVGCSRFDPGNQELPKEEAFAFRDPLFELPHTATGPEWQQGLRLAKELVQSYLRRAPATHPLRTARVVTVGFVDGDLEPVWPEESAS